MMSNSPTDVRPLQKLAFLELELVVCLTLLEAD